MEWLQLLAHYVAAVVLVVPLIYVLKFVLPAAAFIAIGFLISAVWTIYQRGVRRLAQRDASNRNIVG